MMMTSGVGVKQQKKKKRNEENEILIKESATIEGLKSQGEIHQQVWVLTYIKWKKYTTTHILVPYKITVWLKFDDFDGWNSVFILATYSLGT